MILLRASARKLRLHDFVIYSQFPLASSRGSPRFGRDSIQYRVGKTHCHGQGHQDPSKRSSHFSGNSGGKFQDGSHLLGSHFAVTYCMRRWRVLRGATVCDAGSTSVRVRVRACAARGACSLHPVRKGRGPPHVLPGASESRTACSIPPAAGRCPGPGPRLVFGPWVASSHLPVARGRHRK